METPCSPRLTLTALPDVPIVGRGDDLVAITLAGHARANVVLEDGDVLAITSKIISRAEGRFADLAEVEVSARAEEIAAEVDGDPRLVELVLRESVAISRMRRNALIVRHRLGFILANAGIDRSNLAAPPGFAEPVLLLPEDPDASARRIRDELHARTGADVALVVTDSGNRPFRMGSIGLAIGLAGLPALHDQRGGTDLFGHTLQWTITGFADQVAIAADLVAGQGDEGRPIVHLRGLTFSPAEDRASALVRDPAGDLYA